ncbi:30S ribosomal protein S6 [Ancylomarina salipaludis]|uniref:30S ribosomal protein S6 n=1 Tax=Ancylomarina salipaludis TaxID=2501299 RepID=UPI0019D6F67F|nr:30S ribosomal protein S6 [Ancylomarina salipaludis]
MLNHYETVFIVTPVLSEAQVKEAAEKFKALITDNGGKITNEENWGLRKLAYPIQKKSTGFYQLLQFEAPGELIEKLELNYRRDERIIRFLTFRLDKYAYEYSIKRKGNLKASKEEK